MKLHTEMTSLKEAASDQSRREKALKLDIDKLKKEIDQFRESQSKVCVSVTHVNSCVENCNPAAILNTRSTASKCGWYNEVVSDYW